MNYRGFPRSIALYQDLSRSITIYRRLSRFIMFTVWCALFRKNGRVWQKREKMTDMRNQKWLDCAQGTE